MASITFSKKIDEEGQVTLGERPMPARAAHAGPWLSTNGVLGFVAVCTIIGMCTGSLRRGKGR